MLPDAGRKQVSGGSGVLCQPAWEREEQEVAAVWLELNGPETHLSLV